MITRGLRIGRRIQDRRIELRWKLRHLKAALEKQGRRVSIQSLSQWELDLRRTWTDEDIAFLTRALGVPSDYFATEAKYTLADLRQDIAQRPNQALPLVKVSTLREAGMDAAISEATNAGSFHQTGFDVPQGFSFPAFDDAMEPTVQKQRSIVSVSREVEPKTGHVVLVKIGDGLFLRQLSLGDKRVTLKSTNKKRRPISMSHAEWAKIQLLGVMVAAETRFVQI